jgi:hypothetical protein
MWVARCGLQDERGFHPTFIFSSDTQTEEKIKIV